MSNQIADIAVIGLGAMGSATAYQLAKMGRSVIGFEQFSPLHTLGSYHGDSRITRQALGEGAHYVPLAMRSNEIWRELESKTGQSLLTQCGILITALKERALREDGFFNTTIKAATQHGIEHEILDRPKLIKRFPQFRYQDGEVGYYEAGGGFLRPELCISVQQSLASKLGAHLKYETSVRDIDLSSSGKIKIITTKGDFEVRKVVIAVGAGIHRLIPLKLAPYFTVYRQVLYWFAPDGDKDLYVPDKCPVYIRLGDIQSHDIYGFPSLGDVNGGLKMGSEAYVEPHNIAQPLREVSFTENESAFSIFSQYLPLNPKCLRSVVCTYTSTPDHDFVIDFLPDIPEVLLLSPCSGHGFKHSAAIGEIAANLVTEQCPNVDLSPFRLSRFIRS